MANRLKYSALADVWVGWSHLFCGFPDFGKEQTNYASLDLTLLDPKQHLMLAKIYREVPQLFPVAAQGVSLNKEEIKALLTVVGNAAPPGKNFMMKRRFLEVIEAGNNTGRFAIPIPYLAAPMPPESRSPFQHEDVKLMAELRPLFLAYNASLAQRDDLNPDAWWGRLMLSAMINGALLKTSFLLALPKALMGAEPGFRWILLRPTDGKTKDGPVVPRRWFPDPVTRILCARDGRSGFPEMPILDHTAYGQVYKLIRSYARERGFADLLPGSIRPLLKGLETRLYYHVPPWLVSYAMDRLSSTSLPDWAWNRLIHSPTGFVSVLTPRERIRVSGPVADDDVEGAEGDAQDQSEWPAQLRQLGGVLNYRSGDLRTRVLAWRNDAPADRLPSVTLIGEWVSERLLKSGRGRRPKKQRTVYQMVNCIGGRLVGQLGRMDLRHLGSEAAYVEIYQTAMEDTPSIGIRRKVARSLRSLHEFMMENYGVQSVSESGVFSVAGNGGGLVDANVISLDTFFRALNWLRSEAKDRFGLAVSQQLQIIAALGFFCGLRRSEAIGLTLADIEVIDQFRDIKTIVDSWVEVSPNALRDLKTRAGYRCLPATVLMTQVELKKLLDWFALRSAETNDPVAPLFPDFVKDGKVNDSDSRLDLISFALRHSSDDETLRFHHLRHSFATWLVLMLWLGEEGGPDVLPAWFCPTEHDRGRFALAAKVRRQLLGRAPTNRRSALQVSALMGHSGMDITLGSYIHLADFILGRMIRRLSPKLSDATLASMSGYSNTYISRLRVDAEFIGRPEYLQAFFTEGIADRVLRDGVHEEEIKKVAKVDFGSPVPLIPPKDGFSVMRHAAQALALVCAKNCSVMDISHRFSLSETELLNWRECALLLPTGIFQTTGGGSANNEIVHNRFLELPAGPAQLALAERTWITLVELYKNGDPPHAKAPTIQKRIDCIVCDFCVNWIPGSYLSIETDSVPKAKNWMWFLEKLCISNAVVATHSACLGANVPSSARQRSYWTDALGIPSIRDSESTTFKGTRGRVRIDIDLRKLDGSEVSYTKVTVLYGVRFVLAMIAVMGARHLVFKN